MLDQETVLGTGLDCCPSSGWNCWHTTALVSAFGIAAISSYAWVKNEEEKERTADVRFCKTQNDISMLSDKVDNLVELIGNMQKKYA